MGTHRLGIAAGIGLLVAAWGFPQATMSATLQVTSPAAGVSWTAGSTRAITWSGSGLVDYIFVDLYRAGVYSQSITYTSATDTACAWDICPYLGDAADYTVVLTGFDDLGEAVIAASPAFSITGSLPGPAAPVVTVVSPNGGEQWAAGSTHAVTWTATNPQGYVLLELRDNGSFHSYLGYAPMSAGSFEWKVCQYLGDSTQYQIRVLGTDACGLSVGDESNSAFRVSGSLPAPPVPALALTSPNGGEQWAAGSTHSVTWATTNPLGEVTVELDRAGVFVQTLGTVPMSAGQLDWTTCDFLPGGSGYTITIRGADGCGQSIQDSSDASFTISGSLSEPLILFTGPTGGESPVAGSTLAITWYAQNPAGTCYLYLATYSGSTLSGIEFIGAADVAAGGLDWYVDQCRGRDSSASYQVVASYGCPDIPLQASSDLFVILPVSNIADLNDDCAVDSADLARLAACARGPAVAHDGTQACVAADLDQDGDVDAADFAWYQRCISGSSVIAAPDCLR